MQAVIPESRFKSQYVHFNYRTDNTVVSGAGFYRVSYSNPFSTLVGVPIMLEVKLDGHLLDAETGGAGQGGAAKVVNQNDDFTKFRDECCEVCNKKVNDILTILFDVWDSYMKLSKGRPRNYGHYVSQVRHAVSTLFGYQPPVKGGVYNFIFKCSGAFDTEAECGMNYRILPISREELNNNLHHTCEDQVQ